MAKAKFPYKAFVVTPSLSVKEVTIVGPRYQGSSYSNWHAAEGGASYHTANLHSTRAAAIEVGEKKIVAREARLAKSQANLTKHKANLQKAKEA